MPVVVTNIKRADPGTVDALGAYGVATVHEAMGRVGLLAPRLRPIWPGARISGSAVTVLAAPGDNWMIHVAAEQCQPGDIMVVSPVSRSESGYFGDLLGTLMMARGVRGLIIDAGCRDVVDLQKMGFPVWSRAICAHGTVKETLGDVNTTVSCGDQVIHAGDVIVADDDGVVVVPRRDAARVVKAAEEREQREEGIRKRYAAGELGLDMNNMRPRLAEKGLVYVDQTNHDTQKD
jgi:4-hydroxy-4-methyl-2-oxoglutarate aldolase